MKAEPTTALVRLEDYEREGKFMVLHPVVQLAPGGAPESPYLVESVSIVQITPASADTYNDPRYANETKGLFALSGLALGRIAAAAGLKWIPELCRVEERTRRADGHVYIRYQAAAAVRQPNGEYHIEMASKEIDTADVEEALRERDRRAVAAGRARYSQAEIDDRVRQQILQVREHLLSLAETKAKNRVVRRILSLKQTYSKSELARPFVVPRLLFRPDMADPLAFERITFEGRRAAAELYGTPELPAAVGSEPPPSSDPTVPEGATARDSAGGESRGEASAGTSSPQGAKARGQKGKRSSGQPPTASDRSGPPAGVGDQAVSGTAGDPSSEPERPSEDPELPSGEHQGRKVSYVAEISPAYLAEVCSGKVRMPVKVVRAARAWLLFYQPQLLGSGK